MKSLFFSKKTGLVIQNTLDRPSTSNKEDLNKVTKVEVHYSGINYKDALGVCGKAPIFKSDPIVPGIDLSGVALDGPFKGEMVLAQGCNIGEIYNGGYTQVAYVDSSLLIPLQKGLSLKESMILGTAGFTAALAIHLMELNGQSPEKGSVLVSGATGGVGGFATQILNKKNYKVVAVTHRLEFKEHLKKIGASEVLHYSDVVSQSEKKEKTAPLKTVKWAGAIDNLGGEFLESVLPEVSLWGNVCSIGLAKGARFSSSVMPFILRGVHLLGVSSNNCNMNLRKDLWKKLGDDFKPNNLIDSVYKVVSLDEVKKASEDILEHKSQGRVLVDVKNS